MKKNIFVLTLSSFFVFSACKRADTPNTSHDKTETTTLGKFIVDSVQVKDSIMLSDSLKLKFSSKLLVFPTIKNKTLLDSIYINNHGIQDFSKKGIQALIEKDKNEYYGNFKKDGESWISDIRHSQEWYSRSSMNLKSNVNGYMHIQYIWGSYEGGAHDNYGFTERVFDLKGNKKVELKDITSMPENKLEELLKRNVDKINSGATDDRGVVNNSEMLLVDIIPVTSNFYFDDKGLYFHYSPYEIAAFAAGDIIIPISWQELKGTLNQEFKKRMKIN